MRVLQPAAVTPDLVGSGRRVKLHMKRGGTSPLAPRPTTQHQLFLPETSQDGSFGADRTSQRNGQADEDAASWQSAAGPWRGSGAQPASCLQRAGGVP